MLTVGDPFPEFHLPSTARENGREKGMLDGRRRYTIQRRDQSGLWAVYFSWPQDNTPVCKTELLEFGRRAVDFNKRNMVLIGFSTDDLESHDTWIDNLKEFKAEFTWMSDQDRKLSSALGILDKKENIAYRATFIVDPAGIIQHVSVDNFNVGRNVDEILRTLDALMTPGCKQANWQPGQPPLPA